MSREYGAGGGKLHDREIVPRSVGGMPVLLLNIVLMIAALVGLIVVLYRGIATGSSAPTGGELVLIIAAIVYLFIIGPIIFAGLKVLKPNEALVLTLFGKYYGTLKGEGFFFVHPFTGAVNPASSATSSGIIALSQLSAKDKDEGANVPWPKKKISLKAMTLNNEKQKINDRLGNPIIIGIVVIWKVVNTAKAVFNVDNFTEYLSIQCDSALRNIVRLYPYDISDISDENNEHYSLRGSSQEVAEKLRQEIQSKVELAGLEIMEARITHLSYAPEIAAAMLQRQQASAIIDARQMIVEGAVSMVEMALVKLGENEIVQLDEERKAAMVSNLLVILCGNRDAQPVVNSGSLY
ncbi:MAG: SPFH domain-containing protein [Firmicutes bacterium]|jgi:regulator of protease activity HflC (stomatin/prohibitin superfamily)|nr:SPFH domain-containing protein [Bacillota bacterium]